MFAKQKDKHLKDFVEQQYKFRFKFRKKLLEELKSLFKPKIVIV